jgi:hypothetical protein
VAVHAVPQLGARTQPRAIYVALAVRIH